MWFSGINVAGGDASMKRVTMDGLVEDDFSAEFEELHHDFTVLPDETIAFIRHDGERDLVVERAPDGTLTTIFNVASAHGGSMRNHANSIHYRADDDTYTVSDLNQDAYVKVTRQGDVVWVLGGSTSDFTGDGATWEAQHGHHVLGDDRFLFFSNGPFQGPSAGDRGGPRSPNDDGDACLAIRERRAEPHFRRRGAARERKYARRRIRASASFTR